MPLAPQGQGTDVTIELRQAMTGFFPRFGGHMVRRAAAATLKEALDGLERIGTEGEVGSSGDEAGSSGDEAVGNG